MRDPFFFEANKDSLGASWAKEVNARADKASAEVNCLIFIEDILS